MERKVKTERDLLAWEKLVIKTLALGTIFKGI